MLCRTAEGETFESDGWRGAREQDIFPLTGEIPKPMAPVGDTTIIEQIFDLLAGHKTEEVYVNVYYLATLLLQAYGEESTVNGMTVHLEREDERLGTAGGVKRLAAVSTIPSSSSGATR